MTDLQDLLNRVWSDLAARPSGPLHFRFLLQPLMAGILAVRHGIRDARVGRPPYLWAIMTDPAQRRSRFREGLTATARILALALLLDGIYQVIVLHAFYPGEALIVAVLLGLIPYLMLRGPADRLARHWIRRPRTGETPSSPHDDPANRG